MEGLELICFRIIAASGSAKSSFIQALRAAKENRIEEARNLIKEGEEAFLDGHKAHADLIAMEANQEKVDVTMLLMHAEDQMMSAETIKNLVVEIIDLCEKVLKD